MRRNKKDITILAIGDKLDYDSYQKIDKEKFSFIDHGFEYITADYAKLLYGKLPRIKTKRVIIFLFFPFSYWNKHIENRSYKGIYGNRTFYIKFANLLNRVEKRIRKQLANKEILFVNAPRLCAAYRDKLTVDQKLVKFNTPQSKPHNVFGTKEIQYKLTNGHKFFLKPRYGSMGKGITFLSRTKWETNFIFEKNKIISRRSDHGWIFDDITGNHKFLKKLLKGDILAQEAIDPPVLNGNIVDLRIYTFFNKVIYVYPRENARNKITTNISQGGHGDPKLLKLLPKDFIKRAKEEAVRVSSALNVGLAGIDIIPDRDYKNVHVVDVNVFSGFPKKNMFHIARCLAKELDRLNSREKLYFMQGG